MKTRPIEHLSRETTVQVRVRYGETDAMQVAHHGNYPAWFECGRVEFMRQSGFNYAEFEKSEATLPVIELRIHYIAPARFEDTLLVTTFCRGLNNTSVIFGYKVHKSDKTMVCHGYTVHACLTPDGKPTRLPQKFKECLRKIAIQNGKASRRTWPADKPGLTGTG
jgi:acyl-CoA thioester hydrolase